MSFIKVGIVDYGIGNLASVANCLKKVGYRARISSSTKILDSCNVLLIPGVGAFPAAMTALNERGLVDYLKITSKPIVGICLGMQLLTDASEEFGQTKGLGLIPGQIVRLTESDWHIGWNSIKSVQSDQMFKESDGDQFYFNHSYHFVGADQFIMSRAEQPSPVVAIVRHNSIIGIQFHPEKSQAAGRKLLNRVIDMLADA